MTQFFQAYSEDLHLQPMVGEIPWTHNVIILKRIKDVASRSFCIENCDSERWLIALRGQLALRGSLTRSTRVARANEFARVP